MTWMQRLRLKVLAMIGGLILAVVALATVTTVPVWGLIGVAVAAVAVTVNTLTARMSQQTCWGCGQSLLGEPTGEHGQVCPHCGTMTPKL